MSNRVWWALLSAVVAAGHVGCGGPPIEPSKVDAIRISGPSSIAPGATGQFTAIAEYRDGSTEDVTARASWSTSAPLIVAFDQNGRAAGRARGEARVTASHFKGSNELTVLVLEPGTYRVTGTVRENGIPLRDALVEVVAGIGTGLRAWTNSLGSYALYGVAGNVQIRVSASGLETAAREQVVTTEVTSDFDLQPLVPPVDIGGNWSMTLGAAASCAGVLPDDAGEVTANVTVAAQGSRPQFSLPNGPFTGVLDDRLLTLELATAPIQGGDADFILFAQLPNARRFEAFGTVTAVVNDPEIHGTFDGGLRVTVAGSAPTVCFSRQHAVVFRRR
jgi:hypothetical protein